MTGVVIRLPLADPRTDGLVEVLRPEFAVDRFIPPPGHFLDRKRCQVTTCSREDRCQGMCGMHRHRWLRAGRPDAGQWIAEQSKSFLGWDGEPGSCRISGCRYSSGHAGLCDLHRSSFMAFVYHGDPMSIEEFTKVAVPVAREDRGRCAYAGCAFQMSADRLCDGHRYRWHRVGKPPLDQLPAILQARRVPGFCVEELRPLAKLEFQYLLQVRTDARRTATLPSDFRTLVKAVLAADAASIRDRDEEFWRTRLGKGAHGAHGLLRDLLAALADLDGPPDEFARDAWRPAKLGYDYADYRQAGRLDFTDITQSWLREKVEQHCRLRMGFLSLRTVVGQLGSFRDFSRFLTEHCPDRQDDPAVLDRDLLDAFRPWLRRQTNRNKGRNYGKPLANSTIVARMSPLSVFLDTWHRYDWQPPLSRHTRFRTEDYPRRPGLRANFIDEAVMAQIETQAGVDLLPGPARTLLLICRDEGLRIGEAITLPPDCLKRTPGGRWALVHYKSKDQSWRAIPASSLVVDCVLDQRQRVLDRHGPECPWLFPRTQANPDGLLPIAYGTARGWLLRWLRAIELVDVHGQPTHVTFHQFRHTLGTRMANAGVSGRTIREVLGHTSWEMQEHYSRISDETLRREYEEKYEFRFNLKGEAVRLRPDSDLSGIAWMAEKLGRRLHAVSGGWCGRHISRPCPKTAAEGCFDCTDFQTDATFLPIHTDTLTRTQSLQSQAEHAGRTRVAELNRQFADTVAHLIQRVTDEEHEALACQLPAPRDSEENQQNGVEHAAG
ncbi:tyrosine-type recombinase/integrase [Catenulispora sp. NF23]|uniref:tyrosine-type recombinase/integrase n=1 Tax=Catenulispora pinistramenti TaxID=2705254 RepID=UPI001BA83916|nr:tyrosine-type recombinase/integrase [Catenulispora pinistramenti]MBS2531976.1 tyrosine-type recombinase/integrase [Catenulispora pinistramenti]